MRPKSLVWRRSSGMAACSQAHETWEIRGIGNQPKQQKAPGDPGAFNLRSLRRSGLPDHARRAAARAVEQDAEPGHIQNAAHLTAGVDQVQVAVHLARLAQHAHEHTEAGAVDEGYLTQVDPQLGTLGV